MAVEPRLRRGLTEAAEQLPVPPTTADEVIGRARQRRTRNLAGYVLAAVVAVVAVTFGAMQLTGLNRPGLDVAAGPGGPQRVVVFLCDGSECDAITAAQREELHATLESDPATVEVAYESQQDAYERFTEQFADQPDFTEGITAEDLPASFRVVVAADVDAVAFAARYESRSGVESAVVQNESPPTDDPAGAAPPLPGEVVEDLPGKAADTGFPVGVAHLEGVEGFEVVDAPTLEGSARRAGLAPAHVRALSDGAVTFTEYEQLYQDFVSCTEQRSIALHVRAPMHDPIRDLDLFVYGIPDIPGQGPPDGDVAECATRHYYAAEELYVAQHQRPRDQQRALLAQRFREQYECYANQGAELAFPLASASDHQHELLSLMDTYPDCGSPLH